MRITSADDDMTEQIRLLLSRDDPQCPRCWNPVTYCTCAERRIDPPSACATKPDSRFRFKGRKGTIIPTEITIDGERYLRLREFAKRSGFSVEWLRNAVRWHELEKRGVRYQIRPRKDGDQRPPIYLAEADLPKLVHRPRGRSRANQPT